MASSEGPLAGVFSLNKINPPGSDSSIMEDFEAKLSSCTTITFRIKKKSHTEQPLMGKSGYLVLIKKKTIGILLPPPTGKGCCSSYVPDENDPLDYSFVSIDGEELMSVAGLDGMDFNNVVTISTGTFRNKAGKVIYGYPGATGDENISKATTLAGRGDSFVVPTSVLDENEDLKYIFRTEADNTVYTEILSADGQASSIAEAYINYKEKRRGGRTKAVRDSFTLNFISTVPIKEKVLVLGVGIALFNQCLTRVQRKKPCTPCTIV